MILAFLRIAETASARYPAAAAISSSVVNRPSPMRRVLAAISALNAIAAVVSESRPADTAFTEAIILTAIDQVTNSRFSMDPSDSFLPGTNEFLTKPVDLDELLAKVGRALR